MLETIFAGTDVRYSVVDRKIILSTEKLQVQQSKEEKTVQELLKIKMEILLLVQMLLKKVQQTE